MKCAECNRGSLVAKAFVYERVDDEGHTLRLDVEGLECPECGAQVLTGREAERISLEWRRAVGSTSNSASNAA